MANHHFDLVRFISSQEYSKVTAVEYETPGNAFRFSSSAVCLLRLENGVSVLWDGDWCYRYRRTAWEGEWELIGSEATMFWRGAEDKETKNRFHPMISIERPGHLEERIQFEETIIDRRVPVLDHFIESISNGSQPEPSVQDNLRTLRAVFGCIDSTAAGGEILLNGK